MRALLFVLGVIPLILASASSHPGHGGLRSSSAPSSPVVRKKAERRVAVYVNSNFQSWNDQCKDFRVMAEAGVTHVLLTFHQELKPAGPLINWGQRTPAYRDSCVADLHALGAKLIVSAGGEKESSYWTDFTAEEYGTAAAQYAIDYGFDGLDLNLENQARGFGDNPAILTWLVEVSRVARRVLDSNPKGIRMELTHAPGAPYFGSFGGTNRGYSEVMKQLGDDVDYYYLQYYNQGSCTYDTFDNIFVATPGECWSKDGSMEEIRTFLGPDAERLWHKLVVGKPMSAVDVYESGYVPMGQLKEIICQAEREAGYSSGIMAWSWRGVDATVPWIRLMSAPCGEDGGNEGGGEDGGNKPPQPPVDGEEGEADSQPEDDGQSEEDMEADFSAHLNPSCLVLLSIAVSLFGFVF